MKKQITPEGAMSRLMAVCAASEMCTSEVEKRMVRWGLPSRQMRVIVDELRSQGYLDDSRYARAFAHDKLMFNGWGRLKISRALWAKGISRDDIASALEALDPSEYRKRAFAVMKSRVAGVANDRTGRDKLLRFGAGRGFEASLLIKILDHPALWH